MESMDYLELDLYIEDQDLAVEELPDGNAPGGCFACAGSASTASCPGSSAATVGSASCIG
ncbi:thiocillin family RiPP [Streptomyces sp. AA1529]|uniref:thiocillin family RiPP n=1 Tax=Streptomyces sp. AA1529 TaxID=1203257 RepID=UPI003D711FA7